MKKEYNRTYIVLIIGCALMIGIIVGMAVNSYIENGGHIIKSFCKYRNPDFRFSGWMITSSDEDNPFGVFGIGCENSTHHVDYRMKIITRDVSKK